ncbi:MAG: NAD(P)H-hydrate epimerase [Bacteroidales bacterium]
MIITRCAFRLLHAHVAIQSTSREKILIGIGKGNNSGGGLIAARRLTGRGYKMSLDLPSEKSHTLSKTLLKRALSSGKKTYLTDQPDIFIDTYLGFSQRLPLPNSIKQTIINAPKYQSTFQQVLIKTPAKYFLSQISF